MLDPLTLAASSNDTQHDALTRMTCVSCVPVSTCRRWCACACDRDRTTTTACLVPCECFGRRDTFCGTFITTLCPMNMTRAHPLPKMTQCKLHHEGKTRAFPACYGAERIDEDTRLPTHQCVGLTRPPAFPTHGETGVCPTCQVVLPTLAV